MACAQADRIGTYLIHFEEHGGGTCGAIPDSLGRADSQALPDGCSFDAPDRWSDGDCKLERAYTCGAPTITDGRTASYVAVTTENESSGASVSGTVTMKLFDADGTTACLGTYNVSFVRQ